MDPPTLSIFQCHFSISVKYSKIQVAVARLRPDGADRCPRQGNSGG